MTDAITLLPADPRLLDPAADNPRSDLGDLEGLAASILEKGIQQPIIVTPGVEPGRFTIVMGHRRAAAAVLAGLTEVQVIVQAVADDADRQELMLIENLQREDLSTLDTARGFKALADGGLTQREIATKVGVSQSMVSKHLSLLKLPEPVVELVAAGELSQEDAVTLAGLPAGARDDIAADVENEASSGHPLSGIEVARAIAHAKHEAEQHAAFEAEVAELRAAGVTFVDIDNVKPNYAPVGPVILGAMYWVKPRQHLDAPCRVVAIRDGRIVVEACNEPKDHPKPVDKPEPSRGPRSKKESSEAAARRESIERFRVDLSEANERRKAWLATVEGDSAGISRATLELMFLLDENSPLDLPELCERLDVPFGDPSQDGAAECTAILAAHLDETSARRATFVALALAVGEMFDQTGTRSNRFEADAYDAERGTVYLEALAELGYAPTWIEAKYLNRPYEEPQMPGTSSPATEEGASDAEALTAPVSMTGDLPADPTDDEDETVIVVEESEFGPGPDPVENGLRRLAELNAEDEDQTVMLDAGTEAPAGADFSTSDEGTKPVPHRSEPAMPALPLDVAIDEKKGKFYTRCTECGEIGFNTKLDTAQMRRKEHLRSAHGRAA